MDKRKRNTKIHPTYKKYGRKRYELEGTAPNKRDATGRVKRLRKGTTNYNHYARYSKRGKSYGIYFRKTKKKR